MQRARSSEDKLVLREALQAYGANYGHLDLVVVQLDAAKDKSELDARVVNIRSGVRKKNVRLRVKNRSPDSPNLAKAV